MKNLQFKLDMISAALGCIGILLVAYSFYTSIIELSWIAYFGTLLTMVSSIIVLSSGRITRFVKGKDNEKSKSISD